MLFLSVLTFLAALVSFTAASPALYKLVAKGGKWDGLYVSTYHVGAGMNIPTLIKKGGSNFFFNGTRLVTRASKLNYELAYGDVEDSYALWSPLTLNYGDGDKGWAADSKGFLENFGKKPFAGFRVCNWVHIAPELYVNLSDQEYVPCNCENVKIAVIGTAG